jgi:hypothetical protein
METAMQFRMRAMATEHAMPNAQRFICGKRCEGIPLLTSIQQNLDYINSNPETLLFNEEAPRPISVADLRDAAVALLLHDRNGSCEGTTYDVSNWE